MTVNIVKSRTFIALILCIFVTIFIFMYTNRNASGTNNHVNMALDITEGFNSIEELESSASLIARVKIDTTKSYEYGNVVFTLSNASLQRIYKGDIDIKKHKQINILETGGDGIDGLIYLAEGNSVFEQNDEAIVYLEKYIGPVAENAYVIKGVYQGKFKVEGNKLYPANEVEGTLKSVQKIEDLNLR